MSLKDKRLHFVHTLLRARHWQQRPELGRVCEWWRTGGRGVCALVGMGGAGKTAIVDRFLRVLPEVFPAADDVAKDLTLPAPNSAFIFSFYDAPNPEAFFEALARWLDDSFKAPTRLSFAQLIDRLEAAPAGLLVLDGLEKVQEDGAKGIFGRLSSPNMRDFLNRVADGYFPKLSVVLTSRFRLADLHESRATYFQSIAVDAIDLATGVQLLRARDLKEEDPDSPLLKAIVNECGCHALTVDFAGGYIAEFGNGDLATRLQLGTTEELNAAAEREQDDDRRAVLMQGFRFARVAERYRDMMRKNDPAALALLERICLFRLGVEHPTLAAIFTGEGAGRVSGPELAKLNAVQLQQKLDWLVRMRIVERCGRIRSGGQSSSKDFYTIHPAVRDGFLSGFGQGALTASHEAIRKGLEVSLGDKPGNNPTDPATLDLLEEIIHHTIRSGHPDEAWQFYWRTGRFGHLGRRLGAYERGLRICSLFLDSDGRILIENATNQSRLCNNLALFNRELGRLGEAARYFERSLALRERNGHDTALAHRNLALCLSLQGKLKGASEAALNATASGVSHSDLILSSAVRAFLQFLRGDCDPAVATLSEISCVNLERDPAGNRMFYPAFHKIQALMLLGRKDQVGEALGQVNQQAARLQYELDENRCKLLTAEAKCEAGEYASATTHSVEARNWAVARDAKQVLCWASLVRARIELAKATRTESSSKDTASPSFRATHTALNDGLRIARGCGYGLLHIQLLLVRAAAALQEGRPDDTLRDLAVAIEGGVQPSPEGDQPELIAAADPGCNYAWGIAEGLYRRGEALLLKAAQLLRSEWFAVARRKDLPPDVQVLIGQAESCLNESMNCWRRLRDPETENSNFEHPKTREQYNYFAAEPYRVLEDLARGILTQYPLAPIGSSHVGEMTGREMGALRDALVIAFSQSSFDQMLQIQLDKNRAALVGSGSFNTVVFELIQVAMQQGWLLPLIRAARTANPGNPVLRRFCTDHPHLDPGPVGDPSSDEIVKTEARVDRRAILALFARLKSRQFDELLFVLEVPVRQRPPEVLDIEERKNKPLRWTDEENKLASLLDSLRELVEPGGSDRPQ